MYSFHCYQSVFGCLSAEMDSWAIFKLDFAAHLTEESCKVLLTCADCALGAKERILRTESPGRETLEYLEGRPLITRDDFTPLEKVWSNNPYLRTALQRCAKETGISAPVTKMEKFKRDFGEYLTSEDRATLLSLQGCPTGVAQSLSQVATGSGFKTLDWLTQHAKITDTDLSALTKYCFEFSEGQLWPVLQSIAACSGLPISIPNPKMNNATAFKEAFARSLGPGDARSFLEHCGCEVAEIQSILNGTWPNIHEGFALPSRGALEWMEKNGKITFQPKTDLSFLALLCKQASPGVLLPTLKETARQYGISLLAPTVQHNVMVPPAAAAAAKPSLSDIIQNVQTKLDYSVKLRNSASHLTCDFQVFFNSDFEHRYGFASNLLHENPDIGLSFSKMVNDSTGSVFYERVSREPADLILIGLVDINGAEALRIALTNFLRTTRDEDANMISQERKGVAKRENFMNTVIHVLREQPQFTQQAITSISKWIQSESFDSWQNLHDVTCHDATWLELGEGKPNMNIWMQFRDIAHTNAIKCAT